MVVHISLEDFNFYLFTDNGTCQKLYIPRNRIKTKETPFLWLHVLETVYYYVPKYGMSEFVRLWKYSKFHRILWQSYLFLSGLFNYRKYKNVVEIRLLYKLIVLYILFIRFYVRTHNILLKHFYLSTEITFTRHEN